LLLVAEQVVLEIVVQAAVVLTEVLAVVPVA
jgi:hypothetical protein